VEKILIINSTGESKEKYMHLHMCIHMQIHSSPVGREVQYASHRVDESGTQIKSTT
jgi:hypothetical protein